MRIRKALAAGTAALVYLDPAIITRVYSTSRVVAQVEAARTTIATTRTLIGRDNFFLDASRRVLFLLLLFLTLNLSEAEDDDNNEITETCSLADDRNELMKSSRCSLASSLACYQRAIQHCSVAIVSKMSLIISTLTCF